MCQWWLTISRKNARVIFTSETYKTRAKAIQEFDSMVEEGLKARLTDAKAPVSVGSCAPTIKSTEGGIKSVVFMSRKQFAKASGGNPAMSERAGIPPIQEARRRAAENIKKAKAIRVTLKKP